MSTAPLQPQFQVQQFSPLPTRAASPANVTEATPPEVHETQDTFKSGTAGPTAAVASGASANVAGAASVTPGHMPHATYFIEQQGNTSQVKFIYDTDNRAALSNLYLMGSWDNKGHFTNEWKDSAVPLEPQGDGKYGATLKLEPSKPGQNYQWGVVADGPFGPQQWAMFGENPPSFEAKPGESTQIYAPRTYAQMGVTRHGDDADIKVFGGKASNVTLQVFDQPGQPPRTIPLEPTPGGFWSTKLPGQWKELEGKSYGFAVTADGQTTVHADPYARQLQGQLRGVGDVYLNPSTGQEVNKYWKDGPKVPAHFQRFEVQQEANAEKVFLRLFNADGSPLNKADLVKTLGTQGGDLVNKLGEGFWQDTCQDDGRIALKKQGSDAWTTVLNNPEILAKSSLSYDFEVWRKDEQGNAVLVGDSNSDSQLSPAEARHTPFNDPYDNSIQNVGSQRLSVVRSDDFEWKNPAPVFDKKKTITYQAHVGSFMGEANNARRSTFKDMMDRLDYFQELGINTIELLPTNPFEGERDWGYLGTSSTAVAEQYGFTDDNGKWVCGGEALKMLIDAAHGKGMKVTDDVVYNHFGGDANNVWKFDGKANSYFNWGNGLRETDWGAMPAYNEPAVTQLITDSAMSRLDDYHFDNLRFDFTHPMHDGAGGGVDGWKLLRSLNRQIHFFHPNAITAAEEFPNNPIVTTPCGANMSGGAGFDAMWDTEFQHRLVHDNSNPSILQEAANGWRTDMDKFMGQLTNHPGFSNDQSQVTVISNHDEVGNADRTVNVASNYRKGGPTTAWERESARTTFAIGMLSPGMPMFFQGEESLADNTFKWGIASTWDQGWSWKDDKMDWKAAGQATSQGQEEAFAAALPKSAQSPEGTTAKDIHRRLHFEFTKQTIALRKSSAAFDADVPAQRVYTHNDNSVIAYSRQSGNDKFLVVASLNHNPQLNYGIPVDGGKWQLVLDSDSKDFGGSGVGRETVEGGGQASFDLPAGGVLVYKKIG